MMKGLLKYITIGLLVFGGSAKAQQIEEFSLIRENAFVLNPALAGMQGWIHGTATFRKQFTQLDQSPYTAMFAMDGQIVGRNVGIGGYIIHDVTGPTGKTAGTISVSYNIPIFKKFYRYSNGKTAHNLSIGASVSFVQYRLRGDQLVVNDAGDPDLYTTKGSKFFPDASFGVYYRYKNNFYTGLSVPQIMGLNVNYAGADGSAQIKKLQHINFLVGGKIEFARGKFSLDPVGALRWVKGAPIQGDVGLRAMAYKIFYVGVNYRSLNYMVFEGGVNVRNTFSISYAYDFNFSKYRRDIGSTHEVSLWFTIAEPKNKGMKARRPLGVKAH